MRPRDEETTVRRFLAPVSILLLALTGCSGTSDEGARGSVTPPGDGEVARLEVSSSAFEDGGPIPVEHTCDGEDSLPPLSWSAPPDTATSIAVVVEDPDAPDGTFTHLVVTGLPATAGELSDELPQDAIVGSNSFGQAGWGGPCPPPDDGPHTYRFTVVALSEVPDLESGFAPDNLAQAAAGTKVAEGTLTATFDR